MIKIEGCGTALVTPFEKNLKVDYTAFRKSVRRQITSGINFLVPLGTTGETPCLTNEEKHQLLEIAAEEAQGKVPVIVGAGSNSTKGTLENMHLLSAADAFLIVTPYYNKPTQGGLYNHFKKIAESTDKPIIMYIVPGRTSVNMNADTALRLAELPNIIATKEASGNYSQICEIIRNAPDGFSVLSGNDDETFPLMLSGARGVISVVSNIIPGLMSGFAAKLLDGNVTEARELHYKLFPLFKSCFIESNPIPVKAAMHLLGEMENTLREPLYPPSEKTIAVLKDDLKKLNLL